MDSTFYSILQGFRRVGEVPGDKGLERLDPPGIFRFLQYGVALDFFFHAI